MSTGPDPLAVVMVVTLVFLYVLPTFVAFVRGHHNAAAITLVNVLLGWTLLGWVAALVWAVTAVKEKPASG